MSDFSDCILPPSTPPALPGARSLRRWSLGVVLSSPAWALADAVEPVADRARKNAGYSLDFLRDGANIDLSTFLNGSNVLPGTYRVDILVNGELTGRREVVFAADPETGQVNPCITADMLSNGGVDMKQLDLSELSDCLPLAELIEHSSVEYDSARLQLSIGVPQASLIRGARGYVSPELWDKGITAGFVNYNLTLRRQVSESTSQSNYLSLNNGINLGMWRLRNASSVTSSDSRPARLSSNQTYAQRDITALRSQLTLGETFDGNDTFDSFRFRGFALRSDEAMWPDGERGYAPVIRGVAESNATVEVRQNGYLLTSINVTPGPFELSDINPTGSNGDLEITVVEADGRRRVSIQAFASLPRMVREGNFTYSLAGGRFSESGPSAGEEPALLSGSLAYGLTSDVTVYGGAQWAESFRAVSLGISRNTPIGAVAFDGIQSQSQVHGQSNEGQSYRLLYSKTLAATNTTFTLASYRFSTDGYRTLTDHVRDLQTEQEVSGRVRSRFDLTVNQSLGDSGGSLYLNSVQQRFWNRIGQTQQLQAGYSDTWGLMNYNISLSHSRAPLDEDRANNDTRLSLTVNMPIGKDARHRYTSTTVAERSGDYNLQNGLSGQIPGWEASSYNLQAGYDRTGGVTGGAFIDSRTSIASVDASHSVGRGFSSSSLGLSGSVVAHGGGINLGQPVGESFALVDVQGTRNAQIASTLGVSTGFNGFAVLPTTNPYRINHVSLDTRELGADVELEQTTVQLVPRRGSVTVATFRAQQGRRVQFEILKPDGTTLPFGALLSNEEGQQQGITDPSGKALVLVLQDSGRLKVKNGGGDCSFDYALPEKDTALFYISQTVQCLPDE